MPQPTAPSWYTPFYCEENVWRLLRDNPDGATQGHAVFISNAQRACPVWQQRAAPHPSEPVLWDYHVVMLGRDAGTRWLVWDLDTTQVCPMPALDYLDGAFPHAAALQDAWQPQFRLVPHAALQEHFASDRSYMLTPDGGFTHPPPPEPPIQPPGHTMNLFSFVDVTAPFVGTVLSLPALRAWLAE